MIEGLRPYPAYKDSAVPWLGNVPKGWKVDAVCRMGHVQGGKALAASAPGNQRPYLRVANVLDGRIDTTSVHTMPFTDEEFDAYRLCVDDVLLNEGQSLELVGRAARFAGYSEDCAFQNSLIRVQAYEHARPRYLEFLFRHAQAAGIFATIATQTTSIAHLGVSRFAELVLVLPPLDEQDAIVHFLGYAENHIRSYIATKRKLIALLDEQKRAIIQHAVTQGLNPNVQLKESGMPWLGLIPEHWRILRLKHLVQSVAGIQMGPFGASLKDVNRWDTGYKLFGQENTISGDFAKGTRWISAKQYRLLERYSLCPGDLVLTRKGSIGKCRIVPTGIPKGIADSDTIRVRPRSDIIVPQFLQLILHAAAYVSWQIESAQRGAILTGLNTSSIANLFVALPPLSEQMDISCFVDSKSAEVIEAMSSLNHEIVLLREYRARLVADVVTGKVDVREVAARLPEVYDEVSLDDEPVSGDDADADSEPVIDEEAP